MVDSLFMTESEFFQHIEFRLCRDLADARLPEAPGLWCDGLIPEAWGSGTRALLVSGRAWFGGLPGHGSSHQEEWTFVLEIHCDAESPESIPWAELLPDEILRNWFSVDVQRRRLLMVLRSAGEPEADTGA